MNPEPDGYIKGLNRSQTFLLPETVDKYVTQENEARFIDAFVDSLNLENLGFTHAHPNDEGRPPYDPADLLKLFIWGYLNQTRSSRKLERECHRNLEVIWLMKKLAPDFKTVADFRKDNVGCIKAVFKEFVNLCMGLELFGSKLIGIDGTKLKAVNAIDKDFNQKTLSKRIKLVDQTVQQYVDEMEASDKEEAKKEAKHSDYVEQKIRILMKKKQVCEELLGKMKENGQNEVALTDPDCRLMKNHGKIEPCYNTHVAVDDKNHLVVDYDVTNLASDNHQLSSLAKSAKETLKVERIEVISDAGFFDSLEIKDCVDNGVTPYVAQQRQNPGASHGGVPTMEFCVDKFTYDGAVDVYICPAGQKLEFCSITTRDGKKKIRVYKCKTHACFSCSYFMTKCTTNKLGRTIWRWEHEDIIEDMERRLREHPEKMALRKRLVEHPFGTVKRAFNMGYLLLKGHRKVVGEVAFIFLAYNVRRVLSFLGPEALMLALV
jgi:transposase